MKKITAIITGLMGAGLGAGLVYKAENDKIKRINEVNYKDNEILKLFTKWMKMRQEGKFIADYLIGNGYKTVAIYGMHYLGECLLKELKDSDVEVKYAIDRNAKQLFADIDIITLDDNLEQVDAIIVTAFHFFDEIETEISDIVDYPVLSLEDIVYDIGYDS